MTASRKQLHILRKSITSPVSRLWEEEQLSLTAPRRRLGHSLSGSGGGSVSALSSLPSKAKGKSSLGPLPLNTTGQPGGEHRSATSGLGSADGSAGDGAVDGESVGGAGADAELDDDLDGGNGFNDDSLVGSAVLSHLARPNSPMRSSHRVGPIGALGSVRVERGENRWNPNVLKFTQDQPSDSEVRATSKQLASKQQNEVMTLQVPANIVDSLVKRFGVVKIEAPDAVELAPQMVLVQLPASDQRLALHLLSKCSAMPLKSALQRRHPRKVELEPRTAYNSIVFHGPPRASGTELSPVRLAKFDHTPGATVYCGLFDVYDMPTGEQCFFYHHSDIVCESLDPGPYPDPSTPDELDKILQTKLPGLVASPTPDGRDSHPAVYVPAVRLCPPIRRHAIPLCALTGIFGGIPSEPIHIIAYQADEVIVADEPEPEKLQWTLPDSIFAPRKKSESDSHDFWDSSKVKARALECDWTRLCKEQRFWKFIEKNDDDAKSPEAVNAEMNEIKDVFLKRYGMLLRMFDYFCLIAGAVGKAAFAVSENSYTKMLNDTHVPDAHCSIEDCGKIFIVVNFETDKKSADADVNEDKALMRHEMLECLVRIAVAKFNHEIPDVSDCVEKLFVEHFDKHLPPEATHDPDAFRNERLYNEEVDVMLTSHARPLRMIYDKYSMLNPLQGKARFGIEEWQALCNDTKLVSGDLTMREVRLAFWHSRMIVVDEVKSRMKITTLSWLEFLEALGRIAEQMSLPTDEDLKSLRADDILAFDEKLAAADADTQARLRRPRPSADWGAPKTRALAVKLDRLIRLMLGRFGILYKGALQHGTKRISLLGSYVTENQVKTMAI